MLTYSVHVKDNFQPDLAFSPIEVKADSPAAAKKAAEKELGGSFTATRATQIKDQS